MAYVKTDNSIYTAIADALREQYNSERLYTPSEMAEAVRDITPIIGNKTIDVAGVYYAFRDGYDGYDVVTVTNTGGFTVQLIKTNNDCDYGFTAVAGLG